MRSVQGGFHALLDSQTPQLPAMRARHASRLFFLAPLRLITTAIWTPRTTPVFIDTAHGLKRASRALSGSTLLGLDTETRPTFIRGAPTQPPALLQLAARRPSSPESLDTHAFVLDLLALLPAHAALLDNTLCGLFRNPRCLLLGAAIEADLRALRLAYRYCECFRRAEGVVDLGNVAGSSRRVGVAALADRFLGLQVAKRQSRSNWARRPLSETQLMYAANDARLLVGVYCAAGESYFEPPVALDLTQRPVWTCNACGSQFKSRARMRRACKEKCGLSRENESVSTSFALVADDLDCELL